MYAHTYFHNGLGVYDPSGQHPDIPTTSKAQAGIEVPQSKKANCNHREKKCVGRTIQRGRKGVRVIKIGNDKRV